MQLRHLRTFLAVAEHLNITRAATQVHLAQSSVTEQIQALEADLDVQLFERANRQLRLTEAGERLRKHAGELLALADETRASVSSAANDASGILNIGCLETLCSAHLPPLLVSFNEAWPAVGYQLKVVNSGGLRDEIARGSLDVGFGFGMPPSAPDLQGEIVGYEDVVAIAPLTHRLRNHAIVTTGDLATEPFLVTSEGCVYRSAFEQTFSAHRPLRPQIAGEFGSLAAIRSLVARGAGCAIVPRTIVDDREHDALRLPWAEGANAMPISMVWHSRRKPTRMLGLFLEAAREFFTQVTPGDARRPHAGPFQ